MTNEYTAEEIIKFGELSDLRKNAWIKEGYDIIFIKDEFKEFELKLLRCIFAQMDKNNDSSNIIKMKVREIIKFCHFGEGEGFKRIYETSNKLKNHDVKFIDSKGKLVDTSWILKIVYEKVKNEIYVYYLIDKDLKPYIGMVEGQFNGYEAENTMILHGKYTIRIYEICAFYKNSKEFDKETHKRFAYLTIEEIREIFCLDYNRYPNTSNINQRIIIPAIKQINEKTDLNIEVKYIKEGRKIKAVKFLIEVKKQTKKKKEEAPAALPAPDPKPEELSPEKKKYADKLYSDIGIKPYSKCERLARDRSVGALKVTCRIWKESQESYNPLHAGFAWSMLTPDENGIIQAEKEAKEEEERNAALRKRYGAQESAPKKEKTEEEQIADAGEMTAFAAARLLTALEKGEIDEEFNVLSEDGSTQSVQAGLRSVKKFGYTWDDIRAIKRGDK